MRTAGIVATLIAGLLLVGCGIRIKLLTWDGEEQRWTTLDVSTAGGDAIAYDCDTEDGEQGAGCQTTAGGGIGRWSAWLLENTIGRAMAVAGGVFGGIGGAFVPSTPPLDGPEE